jgi:hypothetical protein
VAQIIKEEAKKASENPEERNKWTSHFL